MITIRSFDLPKLGNVSIDLPKLGNDADYFVTAPII